jgi:hypothetical protein
MRWCILFFHVAFLHPLVFLSWARRARESRVSFTRVTALLLACPMYFVLSSYLGAWAQYEGPFFTCMVSVSPCVVSADRAECLQREVILIATLYSERVCSRVRSFFI